MKSLQTRLLVGVTSVFAIGFLVAALAIYIFSQATMYAEFDEALFATAQALTNLTEETDRGIEFESNEGFEEFRRDERPSYYQFWLDGKALAKSEHLVSSDLEFGSGTLESPYYRAVTLPDGRQGRQVCMTYQPVIEEWGGEDDEDIRDEYKHFKFGTEDILASQAKANVHDDAATPSKSGVMTLRWDRPRANVTIAVARATTEIDRRLSSLLWILSSVGAAITLLSSVVLISVVRNGLKPVEAIASAITEIDENSLADRVPIERVPIEISPVVRRLNDLLSRLEGAFHRERAFSSNLAHELRTPLAGLRATLEVHRATGHDEHRCDRTLNTCLEICGQSETLVENLLSLARVESSTFAYRMGEVQIDELFQDCWKPFAEKADAKALSTSFNIPKLRTTTDREVLRVILQNMLSNAVCHTNDGGSIAVTVRSTANELSIKVSNTGNQLSEKQAEFAFDRLWRGDDARSETGEHFGLGLTLIKRFTEALGGTVALGVDTSFRITVTLPG